MGDDLVQEPRRKLRRRRRDTPASRPVPQGVPPVPTSNTGAVQALGPAPTKPLPPVPSLTRPRRSGRKALPPVPQAPVQQAPVAAPTGPGKTVILYEESADASELHALFADVGAKDSHRDRALALSRVLPNSATAKTSLKPAPIKTLTRLVFWGHGTPNDFCHFTPTTFAERLAEWRALNPGLQRVDLPTCNVRHFDPQAVNISHRRSFTDALKPELVRLGLDDLDIRTVPMAKMGPGGGMSKLHYQGTTQTWAYLATKGAHSDYHQLPGVAPSGSYDTLEKQFLYSYGGDLVNRVRQMKADGIVDDTAVAGKIDDLMDLLEPI